jgi:hypothetical protein
VATEEGGFRSASTPSSAPFAYAKGTFSRAAGEGSWRAAFAVRYY